MVIRTTNRARNADKIADLELQVNSLWEQFLEDPRQDLKLQLIAKSEQIVRLGGSCPPCLKIRQGLSKAFDDVIAGDIPSAKRKLKGFARYASVKLEMMR
jgi:hypothetical protein